MAGPVLIINKEGGMKESIGRKVNENNRTQRRIKILINLGLHHG